MITHWCQAKSTVQYFINLQKFMMKHHHLLPQFNRASVPSVNVSWLGLDWWIVLWNCPKATGCLWKQKRKQKQPKHSISSSPSRWEPLAKFISKVGRQFSPTEEKWRQNWLQSYLEIQDTFVFLNFCRQGQLWESHFKKSEKKNPTFEVLIGHPYCTFTTILN